VWAGISKIDVQLAALTFVAGWVDAISYLGLGNVFTANMTGNLVLLGAALGHVAAAASGRSAVALGAFAAGAITAARLTRHGSLDGRWPGGAMTALAMELGALAGFAALWWWAGPRPTGSALDLLIGLAASGMGLQSATASRLAVPGVTTTYVTGTLVGLMAELAALSGPSSWGRRAAVLVALLAGATGAAALSSRSPVAAAAVPALMLALVVLSAAAPGRR
jgi:uncharacterized membrane protein YoaK (UPF0700 family)